MTDVMAREFSNAAWAAAWLGLVVILGRFIYYQSLAGGAMKHQGWYRDPVNQMAVAMFVIGFGETVYRFWVLGVLFSYSHIDPVNFDPRDHHEIALGSAAISILGILCAIRLTSKPEWRQWPWFITFLLIMASIMIVGTINL